MQFTFDGVFYKVARITGPSHNVLALRLAVSQHSADPIVELLGKVQDGRLNGEAVKEAALAGVEDANRQLGTTFRAAEIRYAADDTPPESTYRLLAFSLVERLAKNLPFSAGSKQS